MKRIAVFCLLSLLIFTPEITRAIDIDEYDGQQFVLTDELITVSNGIQSATSLGGYRYIIANKETGAPGRYIRVLIGGGFMSHSQDANVTGTSLNVWDGNATPGINPAGLGGINFFQDGGTGIVLDGLTFDFPNNQPITMTVTVFDASDATGNTASSAAVTLSSAVNQPTNFLIPFNTFVQSGITGPANLQNVGAVTLFINGKQNANVDITLEAIYTNGLCRIFPDSNGKVIDICGVCGGDGTSCLDCNGTPFGTAKFDACGVCGGNGSSCDICSNRDITVTLTTMDAGAKAQERHIKKILDLLQKRTRNPKTLAWISDTRKKAHSLQIRNWILSWTVPAKITTCGAASVCATSSTQPSVGEYKVHNEELRVLALTALKHLQKAGGPKNYSAKRLIRSANQLAAANLALANSVPPANYKCSG